MSKVILTIISHCPQKQCFTYSNTIANRTYQYQPTADTFTTHCQKMLLLSQDTLKIIYQNQEHDPITFATKYLNKKQLKRIQDCQTLRMAFNNPNAVLDQELSNLFQITLSQQKLLQETCGSLAQQIVSKYQILIAKANTYNETTKKIHWFWAFVLPKFLFDWFFTINCEKISAMMNQILSQGNPHVTIPEPQPLISARSVSVPAPTLPPSPPPLTPHDTTLLLRRELPRSQSSPDLSPHYTTVASADLLSRDGFAFVATDVPSSQPSAANVVLPPTQPSQLSREPTVEDIIADIKKIPELSEDIFVDDISVSQQVAQLSATIKTTLRKKQFYTFPEISQIMTAFEHLDRRSAAYIILNDIQNFPTESTNNFEFLT